MRWCNAWGILRKNGRKQTWEALIQFSAAQGVHMSGTYGLGTDQTGVSQHAEVVRHTGFWAASIQIAATGLFHVSQASHNVQTHWIAQSVKYALEVEVTRRGMFESSHGRIIHRALLMIYSSNIIEQLN